MGKLQQNERASYTKYEAGSEKLLALGSRDPACQGSTLELADQTSE